MIGEAPQKTFDHIAVLMGGRSAERDISLQSGAAVAAALEEDGYRVTLIDVDHDVAHRLRKARPDACFNALHGQFGEDGCIQGLLEQLEIPYTHSGVLASALAMHKERAKDVFRAAGIPVAQSKLVRRKDAVAHHVMNPPYVVKPISEGSSVGVIIVREGNGVPPDMILEAGEPDDVLMVERYVAGRELTCAVIGDFVTEVTEIKPLKGLSFYDFEAKYAPGGSEHLLPANLSPDIYQLIRKYSLAAHDALGCRGVSRSDFRF